MIVIFLSNNVFYYDCYLFLFNEKRKFLIIFFWKWKWRQTHQYRLTLTIEYISDKCTSEGLRKSHVDNEVKAAKNDVVW